MKPEIALVECKIIRENSIPCKKLVETLTQTYCSRCEGTGKETVYTVQVEGIGFSSEFRVSKEKIKRV